MARISNRMNPTTDIKIVAMRVIANTILLFFLCLGFSVKADVLELISNLLLQIITNFILKNFYQIYKINPNDVLNNIKFI